MSAISFPNPTSNNPVTGAPYGDGWYNDQNGVTYSYANNVWSAVTEPNTSLDARYVEVAGDDMTGNLTLGTDKIELDATTGAATFDGEVTADKFIGDGSQLTNLPGGSGGGGGAYLPLTGGDLTGDLTLGTDKITLDSTDGSITAAGKLTVNDQSEFYRPTSAGGDNPSNTLLSLKSDVNSVKELVAEVTCEGSIITDGSITAAGSGDFGSTVSIASSEANALRIGKAGVGYGGGWKDVGDINLGTDLFGVAENIKIALKASDGSAEFAGSITAAGTLVVGELSNATNYFRWRESDSVTIYDPTTVGGEEVFKVISNVTSPQKTQVSIDAGGSITSAGTATFGRNVDIQDGNLYVYSQTTSSARWPFIVYTDIGGTKTEKFSVDAKGTAKIGGTLPAAPNIELNAGGSAEFAGSINLSGGIASADGYGTTVSEVGVAVRNDNSSSTYIFKGLKGGTEASNEVVSINNDGSASFSSGNAQIFSGGEAVFLGTTDIGAYVASTSGIRMNPNGSINASGTVTATTFNIDALPALS